MVETLGFVLTPPDEFLVEEKIAQKTEIENNQTKHNQVMCLHLEGLSYTKISEITGIKRHTINDLITGKCHEGTVLEKDCAFGPEPCQNCGRIHPMFGNNCVARTCPICGKQFSARKSRNQKYCSTECMFKSPDYLMKQTVDTKLVPNKEKSVWTEEELTEYKENRKFRKNKRAREHRRIILGVGCTFGPEPCKICGEMHVTLTSKKIPRVCPVCGRTFSVKISEDCIYCSIECRSKSSEYKTNCSKSKIDIWSDPNSAYNSNEWHEKQSDAQKKNWENPDSVRNLPKHIEHLRTLVCRRPTKPQVKLFHVIRYLYPNEKIVFEQSVNGFRYFIDIALPNRKLGFEYDAPRYHKHNPYIENKEEKDLIRHQQIESLGWILTHYTSEKELKSLIPIKVWHEISRKVKKSTLEERKAIVSSYLQ